MEILEKLMGSSGRVKAMRLFLLNPDQVFLSKEISKRAMISPATLRKELSVLEKISFINKSRSKTFSLNKNFKYLAPIRDLLVGNDFLKKEELEERFKSAGRIKLLIASGIFLHDKESRTDIFIVGDKLKRSAIERSIKSLEADIGKELSYAVFDTKDFQYRISMYDKLVRDVLDFPHEKIVDKLSSKLNPIS